MSNPSFTVELLQRQNRELREENDELRETVRQLKARDVPSDDLPEWLPVLTKAERRVLLLLKTGRLVTRDHIMDALYGDRNDPPGTNLPSIWILKLRRKVAEHGVDIRCIWGQGYQLTPASRDLLAAKSREAA